MTTRPDFSALFSASPYPYLLIDTGFIIIGANPAYLRATGRTGDIVGMHIFDAFPPDPSDPESTNLHEVRVSIELAIATRAPHTSALLRYAIPHQTPDGTTFEERYWSAVHSPVFDAAGEVAFVSQNAIDVTDLYRFDGATGKYYIKRDANEVSEIGHGNGAQMHEAMTRILNAERSQLQILFDQAPGFIAVLNGVHHTFEMVNEAFYQLVGHRELLGKPAMQALPELTHQGFAELLDSAFGSGEPIVMRERRIAVQRQVGGPVDERYVDLLYQPIHGIDGRVTGIFAQGNDVTGAHHAHRALAEKIEQLEEIKANQAFQLTLADRIRQVSSPDEVIGTACALLGAKLGAARVGYSQVDDEKGSVLIRRDWTVEGYASLAGQSMRMADFGPEVIALLRAGSAVVNHDTARDPRTADHADAYERLGIRADLLVPLVRGGGLRAVLTVHSATPRVWQAGEIRLAEEVAERTWSAVEAAQAQAALRSERDQSQYIFDSMVEGFAVLDRDWTILQMNAEGLRITQRSAGQVIGRNHWELFPTLLGTVTEAAFRRVMQTGKTEVVEVAYVLPDGRHVWIETRAHPSLDGGIAFFFRDVTERRTSQEQLQLADRRKDEFLAMLAHELRNPLAPIGAAAQVLQIAKLDEARVRHTSQVIGRQVQHMTHLIDDLLDVSRVTRGLITLDKAPQDIRHIVAEAVEQVTPLMQARGHVLSLQLPQDATLVMGDRKRLVQVLTNLLNNAAKYTNEGGSIRLHTTVSDARIDVEVADNGIGMAPDLAARAFELFTQAERSSDRSAGGLGLGLALVKSLAELHGGTVTCASDGIGRGSSFTVCLPRLVVEQPAPAGYAAQVAQQPVRPLRILLVDDNVDAAAMLAMLLEASGHRVAVEHGAREALVRANAVAPDVCVLDIGLPDMDGIELARRLRQLPGTAGALLIALTGYGQESDRQRALAAGFDHHLVKPLDMAALFAILTQFSD